MGKDISILSFLIYIDRKFFCRYLVLIYVFIGSEWKLFYLFLLLVGIIIF